MTRALFVVLVLATAGVVGAFWKTTSGRPFFYDEADYMYAGTRGFVNNFLDRPSLSTREFVQQGLALAHDRSLGASKSKLIRTSDDITFYRHYHGPIYAYWIALCQSLGCHSEATYRASGLVIHAIVACLIFWLFRRAFPELSPVAALAAAVTFLLNRTGLVAATFITQHVMFGLTAILTLLPLSLFCRTGERRYWYWSAAALGVAFSTVETSFILVGTVVAVLAIRARETDWRPTLGLFGKGILVFLAAIVVVWPQGVLTLGGLKGYIYLAYIAVVKKTFTPISPVALWSFKVSTYPEEFILPFLALLGVTLGWKKLAARQAALPWLLFSWMFLGVTMIITAPFVYYLDALMMSCAVVTGIAFGEIWRRKPWAGMAVAAVLLGSLVYMDVRYGRERTDLLATHDPRSDLLAYLSRPDRPKSAFVPSELLPTLHYYLPDLQTTSYDANWSTDAIVSALHDSAPSELLCEQELCRRVASLTSGLETPQPVMGADNDLQKGPLYSFTADAPLRR